MADSCGPRLVRAIVLCFLLAAPFAITDYARAEGWTADEKLQRGASSKALAERPLAAEEAVAGQIEKEVLPNAASPAIPPTKEPAQTSQAAAPDAQFPTVLISAEEAQFRLNKAQLDELYTRRSAQNFKVKKEYNDEEKSARVSIEWK